MMARHEYMRSQISAYIDDALNEQEKLLVERHLESCESCRRFHIELCALSEKLKAWPDEDMSLDLEQKIRGSFPESSQEEIMKTKTLLRNWTPPAAVLATVVLCLLVVNQVYLKRGINRRINIASDVSGQLHTLSPQVPSTDGLTKTEEYYARSLADSYQENVEREFVSNGSLRKEIMSQISGLAEGSYRRAKRCFEGGVNNADKMISHDTLVGCAYTGGQISWGDTNDEFNTEEYSSIAENSFKLVTDSPLSTFSIDVDTASYSNVRRFLTSNRMPYPDAVRIEEMINYFKYDYPQPQGDGPFSITTEISVCPWNPSRQLALVGLQGKSMDTESLPPSNLVFLLDVSGSMGEANKLPLLKSAFRLLVDNLSSEDRVSIVVYAGAAGVVLDSVSGADKERILDALDSLSAGGSTAGSQGIVKAYELAKKNFVNGGNNRVILATDGDFNVGVSSEGELLRLIEEKRKDDIFLTVLGFGTGNYKDSKMEQLADKGNGNYAYIDNLMEAKKVFVSELGSTLFTIAKDVKVQIEFNPAQVKAYRLVGYENRILNKEDFNDDGKDAGELGAGHTVTALYELVPAGSDESFGSVDDLKYQQATLVKSRDIMTVKLRYKQPDGEVSKLITEVVSERDIAKIASANIRFASAVAEFGMLLRNSKYKEQASYTAVLERARDARGDDEFGYRAEFIRLVEIAQMLDKR